MNMSKTKEPRRQFGVIVVDDQELVIHALQSFLTEGKKYHIVGVANNGYEAIDLIKRECPDIVVLDLNMPVVDGTEAARIIREVSPKRELSSTPCTPNPAEFSNC